MKRIKFAGLPMLLARWWRMRQASAMPQALVRVGGAGVEAPAVGTLHLQIVHLLDRLWITQDVVVTPPDISAEKVAVFAPIFVNVEHHLRRAQDVPGISKGNRQPVGDWKRAVVIDGDELAHGPLRVCSRVKRLDRRQPVLGPFFGAESP